MTFYVCIVQSEPWIYFLKQLTRVFSPFFADSFNCIPGIVSVLHTFWADLKFNPHIHCLVSIWWIHIDHTSRVCIEEKYISYLKLKEIWKYYLVRFSRKFFETLSYQEKNHWTITKAKVCISQDLYGKKYWKYWKSLTVKVCDWYRDISWSFTYSARYIKRPPLAESRILKFRDNFVTFKYFDKATKTEKTRRLHAMEFIKTLVIHIPDRNFKTIRYAWIYTPQSKAKFLELIKVLKPCPDSLFLKLKFKLEEYKKKVFSYSSKLINFFGSDPRNCPLCKSSMLLQSIVLYSLSWSHTIYTRSNPP